MSRLGRLAAAALWAALALQALQRPAAAQMPVDMPSPAQRCMTLDRAAETPTPTYPAIEFSRRKSGRIKVELTFMDPADGPQVRMLEREGDDEGRFEQSVLAFVRHIRVPCMAEGPLPARLTVDYVFLRDQVPGLQAPPEDPDSVRRRLLWRCIRHVSGESRPEYPKRALRETQAGRLIAELRFTAPDRPPEVQVYARPSTRDLQSAIWQWTAGLRMPCFDGQPFRHRVQYNFMFDRTAHGFKPGVTFQQIFGSVPANQRALAPPDSTGMACPFKLRYTYYRPHPNLVQQIHGYDPRRTPLTEWLRTADLDLSSSLLDAIWGDEIEFEVPCYRMAGASEPNR